MHKSFKKIILVLIIVSAMGMLISSVGKVEAASGVCSNCHVMHASENGSASTANNTLLRSTCIGCHTQDNGTGTTIANSEPGVLKASAAAAANNSLAGGNFAYSDVASGGNQTYGHNPIELGTADSRYSGTMAPPGWKAGFPSAGSDANDDVGGAGSTDWTTNDLSCAGIYGCHGKHTSAALDGAHHENVTGASVDGTTVGKSFRFLYGIKGWEDADYELNPTAADGDHNVYYSVARAADTATTTSTMSYFCAECHGIFHSGATTEGIDNADFTSPWIRHPVDVVMPTGATEYAGYSTYNVTVPVGSSDVSDGAMTVANAADRIVMCLSCHRAHASQYASALRWDYTTMVAGGGTLTTGCFACHTTKDDGA